MLVITRRPQKKIIVGQGTEITVLDMRGRQVRLHIRAPKEAPANREEAYWRVMAEYYQQPKNQQAQRNLNHEQYFNSIIKFSARVFS